MRVEGYEIKRCGKSLEFRAFGQQNFACSQRLGDEYTEESLQEKIKGQHRREPDKITTKTKRTITCRNVNLLVDIQAKIQAGKGKGYERWAKVFNLKEAAKTLNFLKGNGVSDYEELVARADVAGKKFDSLSARVKQLKGRVAEVAQLKMYIINYSKTRDVYSKYKSPGRKINTGRSTQRRLKSAKRRRRLLTH